MSEFLPQFCGEKKTRIGGDAFDPLFGMRGLHWMVEGSVDFDGVEKFGEKSGFVKSMRTRIRIEDFLPIGIRPAGRADEDPRMGGEL